MKHTIESKCKTASSLLEGCGWATVGYYGYAPYSMYVFSNPEPAMEQARSMRDDREGMELRCPSLEADNWSVEVVEILPEPVHEYGDIGCGTLVDADGNLVDEERTVTASAVLDMVSNYMSDLDYMDLEAADALSRVAGFIEGLKALV